MKKILSILICVVLGISSAWADAVSGTATAVLCKGGTCTEKTGGWVEVNTSSSNSTWNKYTATGSDATSGLSKWTANIYMHAKPFDGNYFIGWASTFTSNTGQYALIGDYRAYGTTNSYSATDKTIKYAANKAGTDGENIQRYAIFKPVTVDAVSPSSITLNSTDKLGFAETTITFTTTGADNMNDFVSDKVVLSGDSRFTIKSSTLSGNTVTVVVRFTDDNRHIVDGTLPKATVTLTSKGDNSSTKTATITATSDLKPNFTINQAPNFDLTPTTPIEDGETISEILTTAAVSGYENVVGEASWNAVFSNPEDAEMMGYKLSDETTNSPTISFTPTIYSLNQANVETEVCITASYTDENGKLLTNEECLTISVDAGKVITINNVKDAEMDFGIIDYTETNVPVPIEYPLFSTLSGAAFNETPNGFDSNIEYISNFVGQGNETDKITVTVNSTLVPGDYTANLTYEEKDADPISASLAVKVSIKLAQPVVETEALPKIVNLTWRKVYAATKYIVWSGDTELTVIEDVTSDTYTFEVKNIGGVNLENGVQYPFQVEAIYSDEHVGNRKSEVMYATPGIPSSITTTNLSQIEIYTGTEGYIDDHATYGKFPYSPKRKVDLTHIFGNDQKPLFDYLYIFGLTSNTSGSKINKPSTSTACNAKTPCYIYKKANDGATYEYVREFDATKERFDHGTSMNDNKLYLTGYCPFAYMGTQPTEEGWMHFRGGDTRVDIYLEDCQISGRYKTATGKHAGYVKNDVVLIANLSNMISGAHFNYATGCSSVFAFYSTEANNGKSFKPHIHIRGNNHLQGQLGARISSIKGKVVMEILGSTTTLAEIDVSSASTEVHNAPITILADKNNGNTDLIFDDNWPDGTITNGFLKLNAPTDVFKVGSIDLGSENSSVTFNGGQYCLRNGAADGTYTCNMMASYRRFSKEAAGQTIYYYGFGGDMTASGKVTINSGTFTMEKNMQGTLGQNYYIDQTDFLDLRLPSNSIINGGAFNGISNVVICSQATSTGRSPINALDLQLCLFEVEAAEETTDYGTNKFTIPEQWINDGYYIDSTPSYDYSTDYGSIVDGSIYGAQSVNAYEQDGKKWVKLLLPINAEENSCFKRESIIYSWATCIPEISVSSAGQETTTSGSTEVNFTAVGEGDILKQTNQLIYVEVDEPMAKAEHVENDMSIRIHNNSLHGVITNSADYSIEKNLYFLKAVEADKWITLVAPFDIHKVEVMEVLKEEEIERLSKQEAVDKTAKKNLHLWYGLSNFIVPDNQGRATSMDFYTATTNAVPNRSFYELTHYDGTNSRQANYYLYELENEEFTTDAVGKELQIKWTPVEAQDADQPIMRKGKVYAIQFPYCPMCNDIDTRTVYDYWTAKFVLFSGKGPQTISGTNAQSTILSQTPTSGSAILTGNYTFNNMSLPDGAYVQQYTQLDGDTKKGDWFVRPTGDYTVKPTEGYMLYSPTRGISMMPSAIGRSGKMVYPSNVTTDSSVPTIADRTSLMMMNTADGFDILALLPQTVVVYDMQGNQVFHGYLSEGEQVHIHAGSGLYVVRGEYDVLKVVAD